MPDEEHHQRSTDKLWDLAVKVTAALTVAVSLWAVNAEGRLRDSDRAVVIMGLQQAEIAKLRTDTAVARTELAGVSALLSEIKADVKQLLRKGE